MSFPDTPRISVLIPTHNRAIILPDAVNSILRQSVQDFEIVIIDDYSTDATEDVAQSFKDTRIRYIKKTSEAQGIASSRNMGYALSRGMFIVNQDDDDCSEPTRLKRLLDVIETLPVRSVVGSWLWHEYLGKRKILTYPIQHEDIVRKIQRPFNRVGIVAGTVIARAELLREYGCRTKYPSMEDWDMILRMVESGSVFFQNVAEPLYIYRQSRNGLSFSGQRIKVNLFLLACENQRAHGKREFETFDEYVDGLRRVTLWSLRQRILLFLKKLQLWSGRIN